MTDLTNIDVESLTEEERRELRAKITSRLGLVAEEIEEKKSSSLKPLQLVEEVEEHGEILEVPELDVSMSGYLDTLRKFKKPVVEDADFMSGGPAATPATMADIASLRTALSSLGGGGLGQADVINTVVNNFGLTPLDSSGAASTLDSDDVIALVDSDYVQQRLPEDVKVRFRLAPGSATVLNSSGVSSVVGNGSGQNATYTINFATPFASADDYITVLTLDQEGTDRTTSLIPPVSATSRTAIVIQQNAGSVVVAVENAETADNQDEGVLNVKIFDF